MEKLLLKDVSYYYPSVNTRDNDALRNVNLELHDDRCYIVTGACGSGKTTLAILIKGLIIPTSGEIGLSDGRDDLLSSFQESVGIVFQFPEEQFFNDTVEEEILYGPLLLGLKRNEERVKKGLDAVGLSYEGFRSKSPFELSSGEQRRVAIASVISCEPSWYIFDEPTVGLDIEGRDRVIEIINGIRKKKKTVIIITQELEEHIDICDEIIVLDKGIVKQRSEVKRFLELESLGGMELSLPYHNQVLRILKSRGWNVSVSIVDPIKAAKNILDTKK